MIELGVRTRIDSGDCFTILPEMTARVPFFRLASNWPAWVVLSNAYLSIARTLFGPTDNRLLSVKVIPALPSAPVTTVSDCCTGMPTLTGSFLPARSRCTVPVAVLISPASAARPAVAKPRRTAAIVRRMGFLPKGNRCDDSIMALPMSDSTISPSAATFPARASELRRISTFLNDFCTRQGVDRQHCLKLNLVVEELFTNTVKHGHRGDTDAP